ncbi:hypothetical protein SEMRO_1142_G245870.1 [Seminavis robusta]|uniref:Uncharacterized protein n=1 Tax=Seminavis robusta TaxID=568900 RepID=A0A9N8EKD5_9STRA|nr:hypothetical protein SEMRO_1142_G245870.1 [Seminavis robusta]|eukprot:Sro1142_g245870.1 n/a (119) ;mRNA; f:31912-32268
MLSEQPGLFAQVANTSCCSRRYSSSIQQRRLGLRNQRRGSRRRHSKKVRKTTGAGTAVAIKQESKPAGNDSSKLDADKPVVLVRCRPAQDSSRNLTVEMVGKRWFTDFLTTTRSKTVV